MTFKTNYIALSEKIGGPYSLIKRGVKRGWIDSIMQGSMPSVDRAAEIAKVLGVTIEELLTGKAPADAPVPAKVVKYETDEEREYLEILLRVLRNAKTKDAIKQNLDTFMLVPFEEGAKRPLRKKAANDK